MVSAFIVTGRRAWYFPHRFFCTREEAELAIATQPATLKKNHPVSVVVEIEIDDPSDAVTILCAGPVECDFVPNEIASSTLFMLPEDAERAMNICDVDACTQHQNMQYRNAQSHVQFYHGYTRARAEKIIDDIVKRNFTDLPPEVIDAIDKIFGGMSPTHEMFHLKDMKMMIPEDVATQFFGREYCTRPMHYVVFIGCDKHIFEIRSEAETFVNSLDTQTNCGVYLEDSAGYLTPVLVAQ
jgi:hypothetical protein